MLMRNAAVMLNVQSVVLCEGCVFETGSCLGPSHVCHSSEKREKAQLTVRE